MSEWFKYVALSVNRAIDFMVDRAWFDLVSVLAVGLLPEVSDSATKRVFLVLLMSLVLFIIREQIKKAHEGDKLNMQRNYVD